MSNLDILILRDPRESKKKCSLTPLAGRDGVEFRVYHPDRRVNAEGRILLDPDGEPFTEADRGKPLFLIDCSWRRVPSLSRTVDGEVLRRRLPDLVTAYPRKSNFFEDPVRGLASIEALFAASLLLGCPNLELLSEYRWRDEFLEQNKQLLSDCASGSE
ncbi:MAG: pre-rRNA-processing protein TSR3 [Bacteroidia bacterium]|jgi:pre-rRNA-processing protein TSR3